MRLALVLAVVLSGCTLYDHGSGPSGDDDIGGGGGGGGGGTGPIGRFFVINRVLTTSDPCPDFVERDQLHDFNVSNTEILVDGSPAAGPLIRSEPASEAAFDPPNVACTVFESWGSADGAGASPTIDYQLWVSGQTITGKAMTSFVANTPDGSVGCSYSWTLSAQ
jgi:hypothetical protein